MSGIARRYARAAVAAAEEKGGSSAVDTLAEDFARFGEAYAGSEELREVMANPAFKEERLAVLGSVLQALSVSDLAANLVRILAERGRMSEVRDVVLELRDIVDAKRGQLRAQVTSAVALTDAQAERVGKALERRLGHPVVVSVVIDPEILGGLVCKVGDLTFDSSLKRQLEILREQLEVEHA